MQNLKSIDPAGASGKTKQIFDFFQKNLGTIPNLARVIANSPAALGAYAGFSGALAEGKLSAQLREQIAIAVASTNACDYCLSAHTVLGAHAGLDTKELELARDAVSSNEKATGALRFAQLVVRDRGHIPASEIDALRAAGYGDGEIVEIIAAVALNIFTNYLNHIAGTEIDFPVVHSTAAR